MSAFTDIHTLGIDPGNEQSAYCLLRPDYSVSAFGKLPNPELLDLLTDARDFMSMRPLVAIEMVASYGMPVGREVFETCVWIGKFAHAVESAHRITPAFVYRRDVKLHLCGQARAKDANVRQALIDRFGGKGTKASPGHFYGFSGDAWQAAAVAVTHQDESAKHNIPT